MNSLEKLLDKNKSWSKRMQAEDPTFFSKLSNQQRPDYLWIGCSDSRVPANQIIDMLPGEIFVHRNVANLVNHTDLNCLSVLQYAVDVLNVSHVIVCGHYGCGGVQAAYEQRDVGLITNWLLHIRDIYSRHQELVDASGKQETALNCLCELNVIEQVRNVCRTTIVESAWKRGQKLAIHGCVYGLNDGIIKNLQVSCNSAHAVDPTFSAALSKITAY